MSGAQSISRLVLVLLLSAIPSCTVRTSGQSFSDDSGKLLNEGYGSYWEGAVQTPRFFHGLMSVQGSAGHVKGDERGHLNTTLGDMPETEFDMWDFHLTGRVHPLRTVRVTDWLGLSPYVGGGVGYFRFNITNRSKGSYAGSDWLFDYYEIDKDVDTAGSLYPHFVAGVEIPIAKNLFQTTSTKGHEDGDDGAGEGDSVAAESPETERTWFSDWSKAEHKPAFTVVVEYRQDFAKSDGSIDVSAKQLLVGLGFTW